MTTTMGARALGLLIALALALAPAAAAAAQPGDSYPELELGLLGGGAFPLESEPSLGDVGPMAGANALVRLGQSLALGALFEYVTLSWQAEGGGDVAIPGSAFPDDEATVTHTLIAALVRWYMLGSGAVQPYGQLAIGYGDLVYTPEHPDCGEDDGFTPQLALGLDFSVASWLRAGASMSANPSGWGLGCNDIFYEGKPRDAPYPGLLLGARIGLTSVWDAR